MDRTGVDASTWPLVRQVARTTAYATGVATAATVLSAGVLAHQARQVRRVIPPAEAQPPRGDGVYGARSPGRPLTLVVLGDSSAAGYGVHRPRETPGALLATGISRRLGRPVHLRRLAVVGAVSAGLTHQVDVALPLAPDVAVIMIGGNDVTQRIPVPVATRHLVDAVRRLRAAGTCVVVGTCPDLGAVEPVKPPLRWLARRWSRQLAAAQTVAVVEAGGSTVSLGDLLGARFAAEPARMFSADRFHPSADGYALAVAAMLPTVLATLGAEDRSPVLRRDEGVRSLPQAAQEAARTAGTEVSATRVGGRERGPAGRWAQLRRRPWFGQPRADEPESEPSVAVPLGSPPGASAPAPAQTSSPPTG